MVEYICLTQQEYREQGNPIWLSIDGQNYIFAGINEEGLFCYKIQPAAGGRIGHKRKKAAAPVTECCLEADQNGCLEANQNGTLEPDQGCS